MSCVSLTCVRCTVNSDVTPLYVSGLAFLHLQIMATSMKAISDEPGGSLAGRISGSAGAPLAVFFHGLGGQRLSWDPPLSALGGLRRCLDCDPPEYGRLPCLPSALPELGSTGADGSLTWGAGRSTSSACTTLSGSRVPTSTCSASSN